MRRSVAKGARVGGGTPRSLGSGANMGPLGDADGSVLVTRRRFLYGAAAVGAAGVLAAGGIALSGVLGNNDAESGDGGTDAGGAGNANGADISTLSVPASSVTTLSADSEDFSQTADETPLAQLAGSYDLPFGTLVWSSNDVNAACLMPTNTANPLTVVGILSLASGTLTTVLPQAQDHAAGFDVYDVRCSESGMIWTEANILQGAWRIWAAPLSADGTLGTPVQLDQGDSAWETPSIAAVGNAAFWQCMPVAGGAASTANSCVKRAEFGSSTVSVPCESAGRMSTPLSATADGVVCTPRAAGGSSYCQLTCLDASGNVADRLTLPSGMRPLEAGYGPTGFSFCFEAGYSYGDGISGVGTYAPASAGSANDYAGRQWFCFARTPSTGAAWCGDYFAVKSTSSVAVIDLSSKLYTSITAEDESDDWGEQLASTGAGSLIVTYQHIDSDTDNGESSTSSTVLSVSTSAGSSENDGENSDGATGTTSGQNTASVTGAPVAATAGHCCRVRVWTAAPAGTAAAAPPESDNADGANASDGEASDSAGDTQEDAENASSAAPSGRTD